MNSYQHVFTGAKLPHQDEATGGIIADEMGLGKSLVVLSALSGSLDRANAFAAAEDTACRDSPQHKTPSKATLILAPSSRMSLKQNILAPWTDHRSLD